MRFSNRVRSNPVLFKFVKLGLVEDLSIVAAGGVLHFMLSEIYGMEVGLKHAISLLFGTKYLVMQVAAIAVIAARC